MISYACSDWLMTVFNIRGQRHGLLDLGKRSLEKCRNIFLNSLDTFDWALSPTNLMWSSFLHRYSTMLWRYREVYCPLIALLSVYKNSIFFFLVSVHSLFKFFEGRKLLANVKLLRFFSFFVFLLYIQYNTIQYFCLHSPNGLFSDNVQIIKYK